VRFDRQAVFWLGVFVLFVALLFVFRAILLPFVAGMAIAYVLDPLARWFERQGLSRLAATFTIMLLSLVILVLALLVIVPVVAQEIGAFIVRIPDYVERLQGLLASLLDTRLARFFGLDPDAIRSSLTGFLNRGTTFLLAILGSLWSGGRAAVQALSLLIITPVVAFYLLHDWDRLIVYLDGLLPLDHAGKIRGIARDIDRTLAGFVRGQGLICLTLGLYYGIGLALIGLNFGFLLGFTAGLISFVPFVGSTLGLLIATGIAFAQYWPEWMPIALTVALFLAGQVLEGNILQPRLMATRIGLHPVWVIFALLAFGLLFGFVGLMIAIPAAAATGVLVRYALARYRESVIYRGADSPGGGP